MVSGSYSLGLLLAAASSLPSALGAPYPTSQKGINWGPCKAGNGTLPLTCSSVKVPLDYTNPSNKSIEINLARISAVKSPKKGSILFNPGGPGEGGRSFIAGKFGKAFLAMTGGQFDLIGFDPRGTGVTIPYSCYTDPSERLIAQLKTAPFWNASNAALGELFALEKTKGIACGENLTDIGQFVGTTSVAQDMMQIVDALDEDGLLRYWGFSYGTALGSAVAAMFPDRMDKIVLDGVVDPKEWWDGGNVIQVDSSDAAFSGIFKGCVANPDKCPLAADGKSAEDLEQQVYTLLEALKYTPIAAGPNAVADVIDYTSVKGVISQVMYSPDTWPIIAEGFHYLLTGNYTGWIELATLLGASPPSAWPDEGPEAVDGIRCSDENLRTDNVSDLKPALDASLAKSKIFGDWLTIRDLTCAQWPFASKQRLSGANFTTAIATKNPILFVGNSFDPYTSLAGAKSSSASFKGSVVLQHDGYGHTSIAQPGLCTGKAIRAYFLDGTLPAPGTLCEPSVKLFENKTVDEALGPIEFK